MRFLNRRQVVLDDNMDIEDLDDLFLAMFLVKTEPCVTR